MPTPPKPKWLVTYIHIDQAGNSFYKSLQTAIWPPEWIALNPSDNNILLDFWPLKE